MKVDYASMPRDMETLIQWGQEAMDMGDEEAMKIISNRMDMIEQYQKDQVAPNAAEGLSGFEKFRVGAGRGLMDLAQGAKQKWLMATGDEGEAEQYTDEVNREIQRFEQDMPGIGAESFGRFAGWAAPGLLLPGAGIGATAAIAGAEGALMPTQEAEWDEVGKNALIGAATGGAIRSVPSALGAVRRTIDPMHSSKLQNLTPERKSALEYAAQNDLKVRPGNLRSGGMVDRGTNWANEGLFNKGSVKTLNEGRQHLDDVAQRYGVDQRGTINLQEEFIDGLGAIENRNRGHWKQVERVLGSQPISVQPIQKVILKEMDRLYKEGGGPSQIRHLEKLWDSLPEGRTFNDLHGFRKNYSHENKAKFGQEGISPALSKKIYKAATQELQRAAGKEGSVGRRVFDQSVEQTRDLKRAQRNTRINQAAQRGDIDSENTFIRAALSGDKDKMSAMHRIISDKGVQGVQAEILQQIQSSAQSGQKVFGPGSASRMIRKLQPAIDEFFDPDQAAEMRGLANYLDSIKNEAGEVANLPTGARLLSGKNLFTGGVAYADPLTGGILAGIEHGVLPALFRRQDAKSILQKLSKTRPNEKLYGHLVNELNRIQQGLITGTAASKAQEED